MSSFPRSNLTIWLLSLFTIPKKNNNTRSCPHPKKTILLGGLQRQIFVMGRSSFLASLANPPVTFAFNPKHENNIDSEARYIHPFNNNHSNLVMHRCLFFGFVEICEFLIGNVGFNIVSSSIRTVRMWGLVWAKVNLHFPVGENNSRTKIRKKRTLKIKCSEMRFS